jgi:CO/xanthine dehydrogenase Mo-binding subunit
MDSAITKDPKGLKQVGTRPIRPDGVDKVTGRAQFGADMHMSGMLHGKVLRSPHAHAIIKKIDTSKAKALPGVKAVVTRDDFKDLPSQMVSAGEMMINYRDVMRNVMAREKVLYDGHAVAAVAATSASIAEKALSLIKVEYKVLPHVIDVLEAEKKGAPILHEGMRTDGVQPKPRKDSNVAKRMELGIGDVEKGFKQADIIIEREFNTKPVHQAYIEPHACIASVNEDGFAELWCSTQGHFVVRSHCARLLNMDISKLKVTASEIGGGFGGKTVVYLEPLALKMSSMTGQPVKMVMSRSEVFRATGPTSGANVKVKIGVKKNGKITAGEAVLKYQAGAFAGSPVQLGAMCAFAPYDLANVKVVGFDIVTNRPKVAAYRAPGAPISEYGVECVIDEIAEEIGMDPFDLRIMNGAKEGTQAAYGPKFGPIGMIETVKALKNHKNAKAKLGKYQGRGVASGFWFNIGGETCVSLHVNEDGTLALMAGTPDIGGSRASIALMAAEELGVPYENVRPFIGDTDSLGYTFLTGGSRATFSSGLAAVEAARTVIGHLRERAAKIWDIAVDDVIWEDGMAKPAGTQIGDFEPLSLGDIAKQAGKTGGPIAGHAEINAQGAAPSFGGHMVDVEVDIETGHVKILRYTVAQDAGKAIHPSYVEGQYQGGAAQGIGWALNEEYVYGDDGCLQNAGFLDYRIPVASDLPMIDTVIVEIPNPRHPYGVRGVGETPLCPPMAAVTNAVSNALGIRFTELPMSPPKVLKAIEDAGGA